MIANVELPIESNWFKITPADEHGVRQIKEVYVHESGGGNIWLVEGKRYNLLVETGIGVAPLRDFVESVSPKPIVAFASVGYYDHAGGLHQFDQRLIHHNEAHRVKHPTRHNTVADYYIDRAFKARPNSSFDSSTYVMTATQPTRLLADGDIINLGDRSFEVLHLPGVTTGTCALFDHKSGVLFTGEALVWSGSRVYDGEPAERCDHADRKAFCQSIKRLRQLPVTSVYPGHYARCHGKVMNEVIDSYLKSETISG